MDKKSGVNTRMRVYHRYLGFFLAGVMAIYAISGCIMTLRQENFLKSSTIQTISLQSNLTEKQVWEALRKYNVRNVYFENNAVTLKKFNDGTYNSETGTATFTTRKYSAVMEKLTHLHKASSGDPLFYLNIFFGLSLLFFVVSSFWMFMPKTAIFKKGLCFTLAGFVLMLIMLFI